MPTLPSTKVSLLPFQAAHFSTVRSWFRSLDEAVLWGGPEIPYPVGDVQLATMLAETAGELPGRHCWSAFANDNLVGHLQIAYDWYNGLARLARVALAPDARGKGLATAMLRSVIGTTFADQAIKRLELNVYSHNDRAIALYRRLGFQVEGNRRSSAKVGDARWDMLLMGLLRHELGH